MEPRIVCAALHMSDNRLILGARHFDSLMQEYMFALGYKKGDVLRQGFIDNTGAFFGREEAWRIAEKAGQIMRRVGGDEGRLYSENLY